MLKNYVIAIVIIMLLAAVYLSYKKGYQHGQSDLIAQHNEELIEIQQEHAIELQEKQDEILEVEGAWLEADRSERIVYRDRERKVVETVTKYVNRNNLDRCRIDDDSLQQINQALRGATEGRDTK